MLGIQKCKGEEKNMQNKKSSNLSAPLALTARNLKQALWHTLTDVRKRKMTPGSADAIASQAREILRTVKVQLAIANQTSRTVPIEVVEFSETTK
jgi:ABC-type Fe3+ transport system permease subunit